MATAAMIAGSVVSAVGAIHQGNSNAAISEYNARVANQNAGIVEQQGAEQQRRANIQAGRQIGGMVANYGTSGVTSDGSAMDVIRNSAANAELNSLTIKNNADIKAAALRNEASLDYYRATNDKITGYMNAVSALSAGTVKTFGNSGGGSSAGSSDSSTDGSSASDALAYDESETME